MKQIAIHDLKEEDFHPPFQIVGDNGDVIGVVIDPYTIRSLRNSQTTQSANQITQILTSRRYNPEDEQNNIKKQLDEIKERTKQKAEQLKESESDNKSNAKERRVKKRTRKRRTTSQ